jgi:hypothetical protein
MQALSWDQTWYVVTTSPPWQWQFTTWLALLDHWQTLAPGILALGAALIAVRAARQKERRGVKAIRLSLAVEIRRLVNVMLQTHEIFDRVSAKNQTLLADDVVQALSRGRPVVYPAAADRVGLLGRVAPYVVMFYANLKDLEHAGRMTDLMKIIEDACRQNVLPLLSKLPRDKANTELKAKIDAMD